MAIIRTDPNRGKAVAALLAVLVLAVGVTVYRVQKTQSVRAGVIQTPAVAQVVEGIPRDGAVGRPARNPFKKPAVLQVSSLSSSAEGSPVPSPGRVSDGMPLPAIGRQGLEPMSVAPMVPTGAEEMPGSESMVQDAEVPSFVLMATVLANGKSSAVLRIGDSQVKVVRVGDMVDGRFRLCSLKSDQAELSDGITRVIAKRGRTEDERTTGL